MPRNASRRIRKSRKSRKTRGGFAFLSKKFHFNGVSIGGKRRKSRKMRGGGPNSFQIYSNKIRGIETGLESANASAVKYYVDKSLANPNLQNDMGLQQKVMNDIISTESKLLDSLKVGGGKRRKSRRMRGGGNFADVVKNAVASVQPDNNYNNYVSNLKNTANALADLSTRELRTYVDKGLAQNGIQNNTNLQDKLQQNIQNIQSNINKVVKTLN